MPDDADQLDPRLLQWMADRNRFAEQNAEGVDLSLIEANLRLTVDERVQRNYDDVQAWKRMRPNVRRID